MKRNSLLRAMLRLRARTIRNVDNAMANQLSRWPRTTPELPALETILVIRETLTFRRNAAIDYARETNALFGLRGPTTSLR